MRLAVAIELTDEERKQLTKWSRGRSTPARLVLRAKILLAAADGKLNKDIAAELDCKRETVARRRNRFAEQAEGERLMSLEQDAPRPGHPPLARLKHEAEIVRKTTQETPLDATHWSTRSMAKAVGCSKATVQRVWRDNGLKPHLVKTFKVSNDPNFAEKLVDVVGLYLDPPEHALVLSVDEKSQIQALDRTQKSLPMFPGRLGTMTHDYKRNGTTSLFAAMDVSDGTIISQCHPRHRHQEWIKFLNLIKSHVCSDKQIHLICDNYATHKHAKVLAWAKRNPRFHFHFTPTSASWLNMVERFFRDLTTQQLRRGVFTSVQDLTRTIENYIDQHNDNPKPFIWTAKANDILEKVVRANKRLSAKQNGALH